MTKSLLAKAIVVLALCVSVQLLNQFFSRDSYGSQIETKIQTAWSMGVAEITVFKSKSDLVRINCNENNDFITGSSISIIVQNRPPAPNSYVAFTLDGDEFGFKTNSIGEIVTDNRLAADNFIALVAEIPETKALDIKLSDGRSLQILLGNSEKGLGELQCKTEFYSPDSPKKIGDTTEPQLELPSVLKGEYDTNVDVNVETDGVSSVVVVTSLRDEITIMRVTINRGNCKSTGFLTHKLPHRLVFGQGSLTMSILCDIREVEVVTELGPELFTFR